MNNTPSRIELILETSLFKLREVNQFIFINHKDAFERSYIETLMWLSVGIEWFERNHSNILYKDVAASHQNKNNLVKEYYYLLGIKQIFNSFKHNMSISNFNEIEYKLLWSHTYVQNVIWLNSNQMNIKYKLQFQSFKENFEKNPIIPTLTKAHKYLEQLHEISVSHS